MKSLLKTVREFTQREWFLLVAIAAITIVIMLFEFL